MFIDFFPCICYLFYVTTTSPPSAGEGGGASCSSVPASPAHSRALTRRSPHARTHSEEASVAQNVGGSSEASPVMGLGVGGGSGMSVSAPGMGTVGTGCLSGLAPVMPPGRRQHSSSDLLLNPANPPISTSPTPPVLKPISSKTKKSKTSGTLTPYLRVVDWHNACTQCSHHF